jgi:hypothetical protein
VRDFSLLWEELSTPREKERPVSLWPSLERKLRARRERRFRSGAFITGFLGLLRPAAVSLAVLIAVLAGIQLGRPRGESASGLRLSELSPELKAEAYASLYLEPFSDIPEGSLADFYLGAEAFEEERSP